jgi:protein TonB
MPDARWRLFVAVAVSAALHLALIYGVAVRAPAPALSAPPIAARLESAIPVQAAATALPVARPRRGHPLAAPGIEVQRPPSPDAEAVARVPPPPVQSTLPSAQMPVLIDPTWYAADQLDVYPRPLAAMQPAYPERAAQARVGGQVTLLLRVDADGKVHEASVVGSAPEGYFEDSALAAFQSVRFDPAQKDGRSVRSQILVKVVFDPEDGR